MSNNINSEVDRRTLLQSAPAAGLGLTGLSKVTSIDVEATGESVEFSDVRLVHDVSLPEEVKYEYPFMTITELSIYHLVDQAQSKLFLNQERDTGIEIPNQNAVVFGEGYSSLPVDIGGAPESAVATELRKGRVTAGLSVKTNDYVKPQVSATNTPNGLSVVAEGQKVTVPDGAEEIIELTDREVVVTVSEYADEEPPERDDGRPVAPLRNYMDKRVTVTPKVHARNHGELDIIEVSSQSPIPHPP